MGGHPYWYYVPYEPNVQSALDRLRAREFYAGRYNPVIPFPEFEEPAFSAQTPGKQHQTIAEAIEASAEEGTRSILDISAVSQHPDYGAAAPPPASRLRELYNTDQPTRSMLDGHELFDDIERGQCMYVIAYEQGKPSEILFVGYSYD